MAITCLDILEFSKGCIEIENEVGYRNAISRSYYAAYHCIYPMMMHGPQDSHQGLIDYLARSDSAEREKYNKKDLLVLHYALKNMKGMRVIADYHLTCDGMNKINAKANIATSEKTINKMLEMKSNKTQI
ncbi:hypothetical protein EKQ45_09720 [Proteus vulgaris]|nr:hypothetical protein EKQ45_09720 [Proteus vulgaris]